MNDQEQALGELALRIAEGAESMSEAGAYEAVHAVLSADPRVIADAMGGEYEEREARVLEDGRDVVCTVIVLPPRKVES